jgi:hypothetical protein
MAIQFWAYIGTGHGIETHAPGYYSKIGQLTGILPGLFMSLWLSDVITAKTIEPYYISNSSNLPGGPWADAMGVLNAFWAIAYMVMAAGLLALPMLNAFYMNSASYTDGGFTHMYYGIIEALGIFFAYLMLEQTTTNDFNLLQVYETFDP